VINIEKMIVGKTESEILLMSNNERCKWYKIILLKEKEEIMEIMENVRRSKISKATKGEKNHNFGKMLTKEVRDKMSVAMMGKNNPNFGKPRTKEVRNKISVSLTDRKCTEEHRVNNSKARMGKNNPMYGKTFTHTKETKVKMSVAQMGEKNHMYGKTGENSPNWQGGKSFELYGLEFDEKLKEQIRKRDDYTCQECDKIQEELDRKLDVHHIDYNKKNNKPENLIGLCVSCHVKTNYNREYWTEYFRTRKEKNGELKSEKDKEYAG